MSNRGRPKLTKELESLDFTTFQEDIILFRNYLIDTVNESEDSEDEDPNIPIIRKFLSMEIWEQNIFIVYLLNKDKKLKNNMFTFKALAEMLKVERGELMKVIKRIKTDLQIL